MSFVYSYLGSLSIGRLVQWFPEKKDSDCSALGAFVFVVKHGVYRV